MHTSSKSHWRFMAMVATASAFVISVATAAQHRLITQGNNRLAIVDAEGNIEWEMPWGGIHDIHMLPDGHIMVQRGASEVVEIDPDTKQIVWSYDSRLKNGNQGKAVEVHAFQPLPPRSAVNPTDDWRLMIAESGPARIIEVDRSGTIQATTPMTVKTHTRTWTPDWSARSERTGTSSAMKATARFVNMRKAPARWSGTTTSR